MFIRITKNNYGFHTHIRIGRTNFKIKINRDYKTTDTLGIRNNLPCGKRITFIDYDNHLIEHIIDEIKWLQETYKLSNFYIFESSQKPNSYHAINLDKLKYKEFISIMEETSCDEYYKHMPITNDYHSWVLRILRKAGSKPPKLIRIIKSKYQQREKSQAHYLFLKNHYQAKIKKPNKLDKNTKVYSVLYATLNYIKPEMKKKWK